MLFSHPWLVVMSQVSDLPFGEAGTSILASPIRQSQRVLLKTNRIITVGFRRVVFVIGESVLGSVSPLIFAFFLLCLLNPFVLGHLIVGPLFPFLFAVFPVAHVLSHQVHLALLAPPNGILL